MEKAAVEYAMTAPIEFFGVMLPSSALTNEDLTDAD
jgi:hypothetical protein